MAQPLRLWGGSGALIAMGVGMAYLYSVVGVLFPGIFPDSFKEGGEVALYFEAAATITVLALLGQLLEAKARSQTGQAIRGLLGLAVKTAHRVRDVKEEEVPVEDMKKEMFYGYALVRKCQSTA
jgi:P-type Cu+ transporter